MGRPDGWRLGFLLALAMCQVGCNRSAILSPGSSRVPALSASASDGPDAFVVPLSRDRIPSDLPADCRSAIADLYAPQSAPRVAALRVLAASAKQASGSIPWLIALLADDTRVPDNLSTSANGTPQYRTIADEALRILARMGAPAIAALTAAITDFTQPPQVRARAAVALGGLGDEGAASVLTAAQADPEPLVREAAARGFARLPANCACQPLCAALRDTDARVRYCAAGALAEVRAAEAVPALTQALHDRDGDVRLAAIKALATLGDPHAAEAMLPLLRSGSSSDRAWATWALGRLGDSQMAPAVVRMAKDHDLRTRRVALESLGMLRAGRIADLGPCLHDRDERIRATAADALGLSDDHAAVPDLIAVLHDRAPAVVAAAAKALGKLGEVSAVPGLLEVLETDTDDHPRIEAARALGKLRDRQAVPALVRALQADRMWNVSAAAAESLGWIGDPVALDALCEAALTSYFGIAKQAMIGLACFEDDRALSTLVGLSRDRKPAMRVAAVIALGRSHRPEALPLVQHALQDEDEAVRAGARQTLGLPALHK